LLRIKIGKKISSTRRYISKRKPAYSLLHLIFHHHMESWKKRWRFKVKKSSGKNLPDRRWTSGRSDIPSLLTYIINEVYPRKAISFCSSFLRKCKKDKKIIKNPN
jgi:hypothetical protein